MNPLNQPFSKSSKHKKPCTKRGFWFNVSAARLAVHQFLGGTPRVIAHVHVNAKGESIDVERYVKLAYIRVHAELLQAFAGLGADESCAIGKRGTMQSIR